MARLKKTKPSKNFQDRSGQEYVDMLLEEFLRRTGVLGRDFQATLGGGPMKNLGDEITPYNPATGETWNPEDRAKMRQGKVDPRTLLYQRALQSWMLNSVGK